MKTLGISDASRIGISGLVQTVESGESISVAKQGRVVAQLLPAQKSQRLREEQDDLMDAVLVLSRMLSDDGMRIELQEVIELLGFDVSELESEI
ncbi:type II toxin-antitoxin system Phd/YefM family antitoxin [Corynebacterium glutamicum]|uniref:type II toxin-antitoxin system Phd/YefM family antitoxin n=1 Tax=Corynebacterium glutamicum TaxID=1718 RepID=UPI00094487BE|nr:hypothetical protein [Corynebacterium glutamicum]OKX79776.1 hypothetical protein AUO95_11255 [Corynebacterium glutamicum]